MVPVRRPQPERSRRVAPPPQRQVRLERSAVQAGSRGLEPARHRGVQGDGGIRARNHSEPQDSRRPPRRKGTDTSERQLEWRLDDVLAHALDDRRADRVGRVAHERQRQVHVFRANHLQPASAVTYRGDDRRRLGRDRGTRLVGQIDRCKQTHEAWLVRSDLARSVRL